MITEDQLKQLSLDWFRETGWEYAYGVDISPDGDVPERDDYRVVVLKDRLAKAVARLNPDLPQSAVDDVMHVVTNPGHPSLEQNNRTFAPFLLRRDCGRLGRNRRGLNVKNWKHSAPRITEKARKQNSVTFAPLRAEIQFTTEEDFNDA